MVMVQKNIFDCIRENDIEKLEKLVENDETIEQYRRILKLLIDNGADRNSTSSFSKTDIKNTYQNELILKYIGDMWE